MFNFFHSLQTFFINNIRSLPSITKYIDNFDKIKKICECMIIDMDSAKAQIKNKTLQCVLIRALTEQSSAKSTKNKNKTTLLL